MRVTAESLAVDATGSRTRTLAAMGQGIGLFHYFGHAGMDRLAGEGLLTSADVAGLRNGRPRAAGDAHDLRCR